MTLRIGHGYDAHRLVENRLLILGGIKVNHHLGLLGHSDADVVAHVIMDAFLGALCLGSIGHHFPDTDPKYKDCDSLVLLQEVYRLVNDRNYVLVNMDVTIVAQSPKLNPYLDDMRKAVADCITVPIDQINIKATTTEKMGFEGKEEGISAHCVLLVDSD